jgi:hypothetical protein
VEKTTLFENETWQQPPEVISGNPIVAARQTTLINIIDDQSQQNRTMRIINHENGLLEIEFEEIPAQITTGL